MSRNYRYELDDLDYDSREEYVLLNPSDKVVQQRVMGYLLAQALNKLVGEGYLWMSLADYRQRYSKENFDV